MTDPIVEYTEIVRSPPVDEVTAFNRRRNRRLAQALVAMAVLWIVTLVIAAWLLGDRHRSAALRFPPQKVTNRLPGVEGAAVRNGGDVRVEGEKCNDSHKPIPIEGEVSWVSVDPPGSVIEVSRGSTVRHVGCHSFVFQNPMPASVASRNSALFAQGFTRVVWRITGVERPLGKDGGVPARWGTDAVTVVP